LFGETDTDGEQRGNGNHPGLKTTPVAHAGESEKDETDSELEDEQQRQPTAVVAAATTTSSPGSSSSAARSPGASVA
jgi:hypothetical protein